MKKILFIISVISLLLSCSKESESLGVFGLSDKNEVYEADVNDANSVRNVTRR